MALNQSSSELFSGFSKLSRKERFQRLIAMGALTASDVKHLSTSNNLAPELAEKFIENVIGYFQLPLGVATNFRIDGQDYIIPMAVEETSIIAALSKSAKWIRHQGEITTHIAGDTSIGQIQIAKVNNFENLQAVLERNRDFLIEQANEQVAHGLMRRGGGVRDIQLRKLARFDGQLMAVIHVHVDCVDAMGANIINQICEFLKSPIENLSQETITMCILSNLNDTKLAHAQVILRDVDPILGERLQEASLFAQTDPYRAATHNKGVLNGIDPILIATGNDWRAVEAGIHAYACRDGQYRSITDWRMQDGNLIGAFTAPLAVGTVGGVTALHPTAQMCLRMLGVEHADALARIVAAVGLVQNLGALRALTTEGIIQGHMKLHIDNLTLSAGASADEIPLLKKRLEELLAIRKRITLSNAIDILKELRTLSHTKPSAKEQTT
jgi:hydroxymethylglutaryl-CoA reductase